MLVFQGQKQPVEALAFTQDARHLATSDGTGVSVYDLARATRLHRHGSSRGRPHLLCFLPNGRLVMAAQDDMSVFVEPLVDGGCVGFYPNQLEAKPHSLFVTPDGERLIAGTETHLHCWTMTGHVPQAAWVTSVGAGHPTFAAALSADAAQVIVCQSALGLKRYSVQTGAGAAGRIDGISFGTRLAASPDGALLAGILQRALWIARADGSRYHVTSGSKHHFSCLAYHPSGQWLLAGSGDGLVRLYDPATLGVERAYTWPMGKVRSLAVSADGMLAAVGGDKGQVVVWDIE